MSEDKIAYTHPETIYAYAYEEEHAPYEGYVSAAREMPITREKRKIGIYKLERVVQVQAHVTVTELGDVS